jgi:hypothetical protein
MASKRSMAPAQKPSYPSLPAEAIDESEWKEMAEQFCTLHFTFLIHLVHET